MTLATAPRWTCQATVPITGWVARMTDDNYAAICFSPDPDFHQLCEEQGDELLETIRGAQMAFRNPFTAKNEMTL